MMASATASADGTSASRPRAATRTVTIVPPASGASDRWHRQAMGGSSSALSSYGSSITHGSPRNDVAISTASKASTGNTLTENVTGSSSLPPRVAGTTGGGASPGWRAATMAAKAMLTDAM